MFTRSDLWAQSFRNQVGDAMPKPRPSTRMTGWSATRAAPLLKSSGTRRSAPACASGASVTCHARASRSTLTSTVATPSCPRQDRSRYPNVNGDELAASIDVVATHRNATLTPLDEVLAGYAEIAQNKWSAWVRKQRLTDRLDQDFASVLQDVFMFAGPAVSGAIKGLTWVHRVGRWMPR